MPKKGKTGAWPKGEPIKVRAVCPRCEKSSTRRIHLQPTPADVAGVRTALAKERCRRRGCGQRGLAWGQPTRH